MLIAGLLLAPGQSPARETAAVVATPQMGVLSLSPDGNWLLVSDRPRLTSQRAVHGPFRLVSVDCLKARRRIDACVEISDGSIEETRPIWGSESEPLLLLRSLGKAVRLDRLDGRWRASRITRRPEPAALNLPPVLDRDLLTAWPAIDGLEDRYRAWRDLEPTTLRGLDPKLGPTWSIPLFDHRGHIGGWASAARDHDDVTLDRTSLVAAVPDFLAKRIVPLAPANWVDYATHLKPGGGVYIRSGSLGGPAGLLELRRGDLVRPLPLPQTPDGPLQILLTPSGDRVVGAYSPDRFYPVEGPEALAAGLDGYIASAREASPGLELMQVVASERLDVVVLRFRDVGSADQIHLYDAPARDGFPVEASTRNLTLPTLAFPVRSTALRLSAPTGDLPARLYVGERAQAARGLVVTFHGGPLQNIFSHSHLQTRLFLRLGFDVLYVDYRGSSGYGEAHVRALTGPISKPVGEDLDAVLAWVRSSDYRNGLVGLQGTSFGGYFTALAAHTGARDVDFLVLDSPLIDSHGQRTGDCGALTPMFVEFFGEALLGHGTCTFASTGMADLPRYASIPAFLITSDRDFQTPVAAAERWFAAVNARGGCVVLARVEGGGHTLSSFPAQVRGTVEAALARWIIEVEAGRWPRCGSRLAFSTRAAVSRPHSPEADRSAAPASGP